jgi:hypothetical protein
MTMYLPRACPGTEILTNPGFEASTYRKTGGSINGTLPSSWYDNAAWGGPTVKIAYSIDKSAPHSGTSCVLVNVLSGFAQFVQWMTLPGGTSYQLSLWVRSSSPSGVKADVSLSLAGAPYTVFGSVATMATSKWTQVVVPFAEIPSGPSTAAVFIVYVNGPGKLYVDDASLQRTGAAPTIHLMFFAAGTPSLQAVTKP